jgi:hypothetical protein
MPTPTYTQLATVTLGTAASSVTFSSIPATYRDLVLVATARSTIADTVDYLTPRVNGDSGANYNQAFMFGDPNNVANGGSNSNQTFQADVLVPGNTAASGIFAVGIFQFMDYSATDKHKTTLSRGNQIGYPEARVARWANTAAITSIVLALPYVSAQIAAGSTFNLYGIAS